MSCGAARFGLRNVTSMLIFPSSSPSADSLDGMFAYNLFLHAKFCQCLYIFGSLKCPLCRKKTVFVNTWNGLTLQEFTYLDIRGKQSSAREFTKCAVLFLQVHYILQEVVMGGMVLETNMNEIVAQVEVQNRMEKSEVRTSLSWWKDCFYINQCLHIPPTSLTELQQLF